MTCNKLSHLDLRLMGEPSIVCPAHALAHGIASAHRSALGKDICLRAKGIHVTLVHVYGKSRVRPVPLVGENHVVGPF